MKRSSGLKRLLCAAAVSMLCVPQTSGRADVSLAGPAAGSDGTLSVLTYNVKGLPWPIASDRAAANAAIAARLASLRREGRHPRVVVLQEAFIEEARTIGRAAGYRHVVDGPSAGEPGQASPTDADRAFLAGASWRFGETQGALTHSGLQLLSDHPIVRVRRLVFPRFACAGFDCLANKGALLVTIAIPGAPTPVDVVTTHLNSRNSSGVSDARSLQAFRRQAGLLSAFIRAEHDPRHPLIAAGDFNTGSARPRWEALRAEIATWPGADASQEVLQLAARRRAAAGRPVTPDLAAALERATDWQFFASGTQARLRLLAVAVPFSRAPEGRMLSDHVGYAGLFRIERRD